MNGVGSLSISVNCLDDFTGDIDERQAKYDMDFYDDLNSVPAKKIWL